MWYHHHEDDQERQDQLTEEENAQKEQTLSLLFPGELALDQPQQEIRTFILLLQPRMFLVISPGPPPTECQPSHYQRVDRPRHALVTQVHAPLPIHLPEEPRVFARGRLLLQVLDRRSLAGAVHCSYRLRFNRRLVNQVKARYASTSGATTQPIR